MGVSAARIPEFQQRLLSFSQVELGWHLGTDQRGVALSLAQSITRLRTCIGASKSLPETASEYSPLLKQGSCLLERLSNVPCSLSPSTLSTIERDAGLLAGKALEIARNSPDADKMNAIVVACGALGADILRVRTLLEEKSDASRA